MKTFLYIFEIVGDLSWGHRTHYSVHVRVDGFVPSAMEFLGSLDIRYHIYILWENFNEYFFYFCLFVCLYYHTVRVLEGPPGRRTRITLRGRNSS